MQTTQVQDAASQVNAVVDHLAAKMAVPATQLWTVLVREARVEGVLDAGLAVLFFGLALASGLFAKYAWRRRAEDDSRYDNPWSVPFYLAAVAVTFCFFIGVVNAYVSATEILNPAYHAATTILNALKKS